MRLVTDFTVSLNPTGVILAGDITDCYEPGTYDKDPVERKTLADEARYARKLMDRFRDAEKRVWILGNHEDRVRRHVWRHAPVFKTLGPETASTLSEKVSFENIMRMKDYGFECKDYKDHVMLGRLLVTHGHILRKHGGYAAKAHYDHYKTSCMVAHTHQWGAYATESVRGPEGAWEIGCLCQREPRWAPHSQWLQGFAVVLVDKDGSFSVTHIPILRKSKNGRPYFYYGKERIG